MSTSARFAGSSGRAVAAISVGLFVVTGVGIGVAGSTTPTLNAGKTEATITSDLTKELQSFGFSNLSITVTCPSGEPETAGHVFTCTLAGLPGSRYHHVKVTESDSDGHINYLPTP